MKAQAISLDLLFAIVIIIGIISAMGVMLVQYSNQETQTQENRDAEIKTQSAINSLTQTKGNPPDWEEKLNLT